MAKIETYGPDPEIYKHGKSFYDAAELLLESDELGFLNVAVVNAVFSVELFLKCCDSRLTRSYEVNASSDVNISVNRKELVLRGHNPSKLFESLDNRFKDFIETDYSSKLNADLLHDLTELDGLFEEVRYQYEHTFYKNAKTKSLPVERLFKVARYFASILGMMTSSAKRSAK